MNECITISVLALQIVVFITTLAIIFFNDYSKEKEPFDKERKRYRFFKDYWPYRCDNIGKKFSWGFLGALIAKEVGAPFFIKFVNMPELADRTLNLTLIAFCTYFAQKLFSK